MVGCVPWMKDEEILKTYDLIKAHMFPTLSAEKQHIAQLYLIEIGKDRKSDYFHRMAPELEQMISSGEGLPQGLINRGNICYINSVLQVVLSLRAFWEYLLRLQPSDPNPGSDSFLLGLKQVSTTSLTFLQTTVLFFLTLAFFLSTFKLFIDMTQSDKTCSRISKTTLDYILTKGNFKKGMHEDVGDFLEVFFTALEQEGPTHDRNTTATGPAMKSALPLFTGKTETRLGSPNITPNTTPTEDSFRRFILVVSAHQNLEESLESFSSISKVELGSHQVDKQTCIKTLPTFMIVHLEVWTSLFPFSFFPFLKRASFLETEGGL